MTKGDFERVKEALASTALSLVLNDRIPTSELGDRFLEARVMLEQVFNAEYEGEEAQEA